MCAPKVHIAFFMTTSSYTLYIFSFLKKILKEFYDDIINVLIVWISNNFTCLSKS